MKHDTLRFIDGKLELLDQRLLPNEITYLSCHDAMDTAIAIRDMAVRGAPAIGCAAAYGIAMEAANNPRNLENAFWVLAASRPTAVNLFWALDRMRGVVNRNPEFLAQQLLAEAHAIMKEDVAANREMGRLGAQLLPQDCRILTYCNAGALATAGHGTALGVIRSAIEAGKNLSVISCETRPFLQGARLTVWELAQDSIPVTLICDNMAGSLMSRNEIDAIVVGADRVAANGDVANKIGTYTLAVLARRHNIPFYVACPVSTIDLQTPSGNKIEIEERSEREVLPVPIAGVAVRNPAFDVTPSELISAIITERGVVESPCREKMTALFSRN